MKKEEKIEHFDLQKPNAPYVEYTSMTAEAENEQAPGSSVAASRISEASFAGKSAVATLPAPTIPAPPRAVAKKSTTKKPMPVGIETGFTYAAAAENKPSHSIVVSFNIY